jgi:2-iminobutanoate/2-iminopropanoate deaminase
MKRVINSPNAPAPVGPYSHANQVGGFLFTSGQIALHPVTGDLVLDDVEAETTQVMENLKAILSEAEYTFEDVVKCTIFLSDMQMFTRVNAIYTKYFNEATAPARETVQVANLPKYVNIEISCIAYK